MGGSSPLPNQLHFQVRRGPCLGLGTQGSGRGRLHWWLRQTLSELQSGSCSHSPPFIFSFLDEKTTKVFDPFLSSNFPRFLPSIGNNGRLLLPTSILLVFSAAPFPLFLHLLPSLRLTSRCLLLLPNPLLPGLTRTLEDFEGL